MKAANPDVRKIASVSAIFSVAVFCLLLYWQGVAVSSIVQSATKSGITLTVVGLFWDFFERQGWRWPVFRLGGWLCAHPDLEGRWEGNVCRFRGDTPHPFVLEVHQTFTTLSFRTYSTHSRGHSTLASMMVREDGTFFVAALWQTTTRRRDDPAAEDTFDGASFWELSIDGNDKKIHNIYFTRREPSTKGEVELEWKSKKRLGRFQP